MLAACGRLGFDPHVDASVLVADATSDTSEPSDLLLHLTFDDAIVDATGKHTVDCIGTCPQLTGGSARFTGSECIAVVDAPTLQPAQLTLVAHANYAAPLSPHNVVGRALDGAVSNRNTIELFADTGSAWVLGSVDTSMSSPQQPDAWQQVTGTFDGVQLRLYLDGVFAQTASVDPLDYRAGDQWLIGCDRNGGVLGDFAIGELDDVHIYGRALSASEIQALAE